MNNRETTVLRYYEGRGTISFITNKRFDCNFILNYYDSGRITLTCNLTLSSQFLTIIESEATKDEKIVLEASFTGVTSDGGMITIERMGLDRTTACPNRVRSNIYYDGRTLKISDQILSVSGRGLFVFVVTSNVHIDYSLPKDNDIVIAKWFIVNLHFVGCQRSIKRIPVWDRFCVKSGDLNLQLTQSSGYQLIIEELTRTGKSAVTADVEVITTFERLSVVYDKLLQLCWILSFTTSNWVMPLFCDIFSKSTINRSILYPGKLAYPFMKDRQVVELHSRDFLIEDFAQKTLENYDHMKNDFGLNAIIEYYLAAIRQKTPEARFLMGMIAFESLSSYVPKYAVKNNDQLVSKDIELKKKAITKVGKKLDLRLADAAIEEIAKAVAINSIGLKNNLRYMFHRFNVQYSNNDLNALVAIRGALVHSGKYYNYGELLNKTDVLFNLLIVIILRMLGWDRNVRRLLF